MVDPAMFWICHTSPLPFAPVTGDVELGHELPQALAEVDLGVSGPHGLAHDVGEDEPRLRSARDIAFVPYAGIVGIQKPAGLDAQ